VLGWYRRALGERGGCDGQSGAITVVQRTQADLRLNPHLHTIFLDGVFAPTAASKDFLLPSLLGRAQGTASAS
jgi:hypothetical protein